jgi:hypothetical protein
MTLQEYLGDEYTVTQLTDEDQRVSFNVKRDGFEYTTFSYHPVQAVSLSIIKVIGMTVETKYSSWKFLQELK